MRGETPADRLELQTGSPQTGFFSMAAVLAPFRGGVHTRNRPWVSAGKPKAANWGRRFLQEEDVMETCLGWDFTFAFGDFLFSKAEAGRVKPSCLTAHKRIMRPQRSLHLLGAAGGELGLAECNW